MASKYNNAKIRVDGRLFDSKAEAARWLSYISVRSPHTGHVISHLHHSDAVHLQHQLALEDVYRRLYPLGIH